MSHALDVALRDEYFYRQFPLQAREIQVSRLLGHTGRTNVSCFPFESSAFDWSTSIFEHPALFAFLQRLPRF